MWKVRELADKVTNVVMNYTEIESKVREATNDDPWGPTGTLKHELSQATFSYDLFPEVMGMLWKRIAENKRSPRRIYKSLLLLHHLLLHGSDRVVRATQDRLYEVRQLQDYHAIEDPGFTLNAIIPASGTETKDGEANVRVKAKELVELIQEEEKLRDERKKARKNRDKYVGIGSDKMMTSKWTEDYDYGNNDDERSPPSKSKKPFSDEDSGFTRSTSSTSNNNSFKIKPRSPSPAIEAVDDFDPRSGESDFGDFRSAPTIATTTKTSQASNTSNDFADFQSAFGGSVPPPSSSVSASATPGPAMSDPLGEFDQIVTSTNTSANQQNDDLLGLSFGGFSSMNTSASSSSFMPQLGNSGGAFPNSGMGGMTHSATAPTSLPAFPQMGGIPTNNGIQTPSPVVQFPAGGGMGFPAAAQFQQAPMSLTSPTSANNSDALDLFGLSSSSVPAAPVLIPDSKSSNGAIPSSNSASNNINNNSNPSLKGTTWSDLNISLGDLNLSRGNSKNSPVKTTINQMRAPAATTAANNFAAFK